MRLRRPVVEGGDVVRPRSDCAGEGIGVVDQGDHAVAIVTDQTRGSSSRAGAGTQKPRQPVGFLDDGLGTW